MFSKILVAIDQSSLGEHIFEKASELASTLQANLMLLHVLSSDEEGSPQLSMPSAIGAPSLGMDSAALEIYQKQWQAYEQRGLEFLQSHLEIAQTMGISVEFTQAVGHPGRSICALAERWQANLIIIGRRGRSGLSELFLGSVSNYVLHHAPCDVLTIHTPTTKD